MRAGGLSAPQAAELASIYRHGHDRKTLRVDGFAPLANPYLLCFVILQVFAKKTGATPKAVIATCRERPKEYENAGK